MNESLAFLPFCVSPVPPVTRLRERMARLLSISTLHSRHSFFPVATRQPLSPTPSAKIRNMTPPPSHHQPFDLRISFQVSSAVCFLLSPGASFVSGATLRVDAGGSLYSRLMWAIPGMGRLVEIRNICKWSKECFFSFSRARQDAGVLLAERAGEAQVEAVTKSHMIIVTSGDGHFHKYISQFSTLFFREEWGR